MLTADYDRLGLRSGETLLDLGCGFGRHSYEALRRGAHIVACDLGLDELNGVISIAQAMRDDELIADDIMTETTQGDATCLPYNDDSFERVIASEVLEHIPDDEAAFSELARVLKPGGTLAVTIPAEFPEKICWKLSDEYYAPKAEGGHVRIYKESEVKDKMRAAGLDPVDSHRAHALHAPYWWLRCKVGVNNEIEDNKMVSLYHKLLSWDIVKAPAVTRLTERALNPVLGKSLIVYANKPADVRASLVAA
jgi:SAM-dependent methyltransferase